MNKTIDSLVEEQLQKAFAYGLEVGRLHPGYRVVGGRYKPNAEVQVIQDYLNVEITKARIDELEKLTPQPTSLGAFYPTNYIKNRIKALNLKGKG